MSNYLRQLASESFIYGISGTVAKFLQFMLVPLYTRIFIPEDYGVLSLVTTTIGVVAIFVVLALDNSAARWYWDTNEVKDRKRTLASWAWCQLCTATFFSLLILAASNRLAQFILGSNENAIYFRLSALTLPLSALVLVTINWLRLQRRPWATMLYALGSSLLTILLTLYFVLILHWGLSGVYIAQIGANAISSLVAVAWLRDWIHPRYFHWGRLGEMLQFAIPLIPAALAFWVVSLSDRYFVQYFASTNEVGLYQFGASIASVVALATGAFQKAWGPFAMSIHTNEQAPQIYANVLLTYTWVTCLFSTALTLFTPELVYLLAPATYVSAGTVVSFLAFSSVMGGLTYIAAIGLNIVKTNRPTATAVFIAAGLNMLLNLLLVPKMGKLGSALATLLSQSVVPIYIFCQAQRLYPIPYRFHTAAMIFALSFFIILIVSLLPLPSSWIMMFLLKVSLLLLFIPALLLLRIISLEQVRQLFGRRPASL